MRTTALLLAVAACHAAPKSTADLPQTVSLSIPATTVVAGAAGLTLRAQVTGTADPVSWSLEGPGSLSESVGSTTLYTPPACVVHPSSAKVTAAVGAASASATVEITAATDASACVEISPAISDVGVGDASVLLTATTSDPRATVSWSLFGPGSLSAATGATTLYTPPDTIGNDVNLTVTASVGDGVATHAIVRVHPRPSFPLDQMPVALAFDGSRIWVAEANASGRVTMLQSSDGAPAGTVSVDDYPFQMLFDGANMWVVIYHRVPCANYANCYTETFGLEKIRASDGVKLFGIDLPDGFSGMTWDGESLWVSKGFESRTVSKLRASDGATILDVTGLSRPGPLASDGTYVWAAEQVPTVTQIRASDGANLGDVWIGDIASDLRIGGSQLLAFLRYNGQPYTRVTRVDLAGAYVTSSGSFGSSYFWSLLIDGDTIWGIHDNGYVTRMRVGDGSVLADYRVPSARTIVSDGAHLWVGVQTALVKL